MRKAWLGTGALLSLAAGLAASVLYFLGFFSEARYKIVLLIASAAWFVLATLWADARKAR